MARAIRPTVLLALATGAIILTLLLTGVLGGSGPAPAGAATAKRSHHARTHHARTQHPRAHKAQTTENDGEANGAENESATENESAGENESAAEPAGEAQPGHEDAQGQQVDHQCPPDCAAGELP
jgi:hypothetical protein